MRINHGPGYRVYYGWHGTEIVLLLLAGDKSTQQADIARGRKYLVDFKEKRHEFRQYTGCSSL